VKFLADESVDYQIVDHLRQDGHEIWYVAEMQPGISDDAVLDEANKKMAILLTSDKDFGELVFRQGRISWGVLLIRLAGISQASKAKIVADAIRKHSKEIKQGFAVLTPAAIRIRRQKI